MLRLVEVVVLEFDCLVGRRRLRRIYCTTTMMTTITVHAALLSLAPLLYSFSIDETQALHSFVVTFQTSAVLTNAEHELLCHFN